MVEDRGTAGVRGPRMRTCMHTPIQYTIGGVTTRAVSDFLTHVNLLERTVNREWASAEVREEKKTLGFWARMGVTADEAN